MRTYTKVQSHIDQLQKDSLKKINEWTLVLEITILGLRNSLLMDLGQDQL